MIHLPSKAQDVAEVVCLRANVTIIEDDTLNYIAKENARMIIVSFNEDDPDKLQDLIDSIEPTWFVDLDVFIGDDLDGVIEHIQNTPHAAFMEHKGNILIDVSEVHDLCLVTVYCLPNVNK